MDDLSSRLGLPVRQSSKTLESQAAGREKRRSKTNEIAATKYQSRLQSALEKNDKSLAGYGAGIMDAGDTSTGGVRIGPGTTIEKTPANDDDCKELDFVAVIHGPLFLYWPCERGRQ